MVLSPFFTFSTKKKSKKVIFFFFFYIKISKNYINGQKSLDPNDKKSFLGGQKAL
jgi:hypothetical protein